MEFDERRYRPLSTVDLFDEAFDLYKKNFVLFLAIVSFVVVPSTILNDIFLLKWMGGLATQMQNASESGDSSSTALLYLADFLKQSGIAFLIYIPAWTLVFAALTAAVSARYHDRPISLGQACIEGGRRWFSGLVATMLFLVLTLIGYIFVPLASLDPDLAAAIISLTLLVGSVPTLIVMTRYPLFMGAVVAEKLGPINALKRSAQLTKTDTGRIIWTIICMGFISLIVTLAIDGVFQIFTGKLVDSAYLDVPALADNEVIASQIAFGLAYLLLTPFSVVVMTLIYFDQRIRKEGYDMEILADRLGYEPVIPTAKPLYSPALTTKPKRGEK